MAKWHRAGKEGRALRTTPASGKGPDATANEWGLMQPAADFFEKRAVRGPFRVPQARRGVDGGRQAQTLELGPERVIVGMGKVAALDKHGPDKGAAEARHLGHPLQLLQGEVHVLEWHHGGSKEPVRRSHAEIGDPVVVRPR